MAAFFFIADVYKELYDAAIMPIRDGVCERVDGDILGFEQRFIVDAIVQVSCEAGVVPEL